MIRSQPGEKCLEIGRKFLIAETKEFNNVAVYKINAQKLAAFLYTNKKTEKGKIRSQSRLQLNPKP